MCVRATCARCQGVGECIEVLPSRRILAQSELHCGIVGICDHREVDASIIDSVDEVANDLLLQLLDVGLAVRHVVDDQHVLCSGAARYKQASTF